MIKRKVTKITQPLQIKWEAVQHFVELLIPDGVGLMNMILVNGNKLN
jgi:hypothetical protein